MIKKGPIISEVHARQYARYICMYLVKSKTSETCYDVVNIKNTFKIKWLNEFKKIIESDVKMPKNKRG